MVTTTTPNGSARLRALFEDRVRHVYTPYDLRSAVGRFLDAVAPRLVLVMETEVWPNLLAECQRRRTPVVLANARLSARSAKGYARVGGFARETFARFTLMAAGDVAFIGGSLVRVGGHNLLEAAVVGVPAVIGPYSYNFATITRLMVEEGAAVQVQDAAGLTRQLRAWLGDAAERARVGENGLRVMVENRGALPRLLALPDGLLGESGPGRV